MVQDSLEINGEDLKQDLMVPAKAFFSFTPSDTVDETVICRAIHCNIGGTIRVLGPNNESGEEIDLEVYAGQMYPYRIKRVFSTGTTATIIGII